MKTGAELIAQERARQIEEKGYTVEYDMRHDDLDLLHAALCYLMYHHPENEDPMDPVHNFWPWKIDTFKADDQLTMLIKSGAMIAALIDKKQAK